MIHHGDCLEILKTFENDSIDALITDPPAGISFMGKDWDHHKGGREQWIEWMTGVMKECLRVLKPGAHGLVWAIPRTSHWTATALEDAGFEVRDVITHLFGSGFPKSVDISKAIDKAAGAEREVISSKVKKATDMRGGNFNKGKDYQTIELYKTSPATTSAKQWQGWGTALKPASEHWILVRKPLSEKTVAANVLKHGTGGINIDASRITALDNRSARYNGKPAGGNAAKFSQNTQTEVWNAPAGRFPANLVLSHNEDCEGQCTPGCAVAELDKQSGILKTHGGGFGEHKSIGMFSGGRVTKDNQPKDIGGASRFFFHLKSEFGLERATRFLYCAKASKKDKGVGNSHPTVKSTKLMSYLITMITPPKGVILDPFAGSGSTGVAAIKDGFNFIGIEQNQEYLEIAEKRLTYAR